MATVYLLEDDKSICELVKLSLQMAGVDAIYFETAEAFFKGLGEKLPDLVLLDVMLPDANGLDVLKKIKARYSDLPVIMLSAKQQEVDKVAGLNLGAEDYIVKPFGVLELNARINVALRRLAKKVTKGNLEIDESKMQARFKGEELKLNPKEFMLLKYFVKNEGVVLSREKLLDAVWGYDIGETRTVDNHIARLRRIGIEIETVHGFGYKYVVVN